MFSLRGQQEAVGGQHDVPCMFPLHNGRRHKHAFLVHGHILTTNCSSNEVGTTYFYLRWEERHGIHNTLFVN